MSEERLTEDDLRRIIDGEYTDREARDADWLERAGREIQALRDHIAKLEACMKRAGLIAFMRGTPEEVANHLHEVAESNVDYIAELEKKLKEQEEMLDALKRGKVF